jgi:hypothetical protein
MHLINLGRHSKNLLRINYDHSYGKGNLITNSCATSSSTVVECPPHHPKVEGSSPATAVGTGRENGVKTIQRQT